MPDPLRDRLVTDIQALRSTLPGALPASVAPASLDALQTWLQQTVTDHPWAADLHAVLDNALIVTPHLSYGWPEAVADEGAVAAALRPGEDAEFKQQNLEAALAAYRFAASVSRPGPIRLAGEARVARTSRDKTAWAS